MQENKYFVPQIGDLRVGYECELIAPDWLDKKFIVDENQFQYADFCINAGLLKVPYLTKEQIEAEGWKLSYDYSHLGIDHGIDFEKGDVWKDNGKGMFLTWNPHTNIIKITTTDKGFNSDGPNHSIKFFGECKSINEFRTICKLLNIK